MQFTPTVLKHTLNFHFSAGTSRGVLQKKDSWFLKLEAGGRFGVGEAGPLSGLSPEGTALDGLWPPVLQALKFIHPPSSEQEVFLLAAQLAGGVASIRFALETALLDWLRGGDRVLYRNSFTMGHTSIPINGLIWMADRETMKARIDEKIAQGFNCLKLKIGAIDFKEELSLLEYIRSHYNAKQLIIRVDANGAFAPAQAREKLQRLAVWQIHSIEQPIQPGQWEAMRSLCKDSAIPVALDEELIGVTDSARQAALLDYLMPPYIILKPSLLGGLAATDGWIRLAEERGIGWWITSALEANIGLNAIAQFTATYSPELPQGLGTGQLYTNNLPSPLVVAGGKLHHKPQDGWDLSLLGW
jgi:O-succinylbenzoate synthase